MDYLVCGLPVAFNWKFSPFTEWLWCPRYCCRWWEYKEQQSSAEALQPTTDLHQREGQAGKRCRLSGELILSLLMSWGWPKEGQSLKCLRAMTFELWYLSTVCLLDVSWPVYYFLQRRCWHLNKTEKKKNPNLCLNIKHTYSLATKPNLKPSKGYNSGESLGGLEIANWRTEPSVPC